MGKQNKSNRTYPVRLCKNPICDYGNEYTPTWYTQKFCCTQCRVNFHNDQRRTKAGGTHSDKKLLEMTDKLLGEINRKATSSGIRINDSLLKYDGVDIRLSVSQETNKQSGNQIRWFYEYGLEFLPQENRYVIHQKSKRK